jgi:hypothetical protein
MNSVVLTAARQAFVSNATDVSRRTAHAIRANMAGLDRKSAYSANENRRAKMPKGKPNKPSNFDVIDKRFRVLSDNDGHHYIIPVGHEGDFYSWVEATEDDVESEFDFENNRINNSGWTFTNPKGY